MTATDRREQIMSCAMRLFEQHSYLEVSITDIANEAGVGRPLIYHYFGTKRDLYLEVVRRLSYIPAIAVTGLQGRTVEERIEASIERWLSVAARHRNLWVQTVTETSGLDRELGRIQRSADEVAVERMLDAIGLDVVGADGDKLRMILLAFGGMAKGATRLWLVDALLSRQDVHSLLSTTLKTLVNEWSVRRGEARRPQ